MIFLWYFGTDRGKLDNFRIFHFVLLRKKSLQIFWEMVITKLQHYQRSLADAVSLNESYSSLGCNVENYSKIEF